MAGDKVLFVHGVGGPENEPYWPDKYVDLLVENGQFQADGIGLLLYDGLFEQVFEGREATSMYIEALVRLVASYKRYRADGESLLDDVLRAAKPVVVDFLVQRFLERIGYAATPEEPNAGDDQAQWTAGMVAAWSTDPKLRKRLRKNLIKYLEEHDPKIIVAHSLGSLIAFDTFSTTECKSQDDESGKKSGPEWLEGRLLITSGSQIGNPALRDVFGGRFAPLRGDWINLFNPYDCLMVKPIRRLDDGGRRLIELDVADERCERFEANCVLDLDHCEACYYAHPETTTKVWPSARDWLTGDESLDLLKGSPQDRPPVRRALLIGTSPQAYEGLAETIDDDLELMDDALENLGFDPADIFHLEGSAATKGRILQELALLVQGTRPGDVLFVYFSGFGAFVPKIGLDGQPIVFQEALVPFDASWDDSHFVFDQDLVEIYADLEEGVSLTFALDCAFRLEERVKPTFSRSWMPKRVRYDLGAAPRLVADAEGKPYAAKDLVGERATTEMLGRATVARYGITSLFDRILQDDDMAAPLQKSLEVRASGSKATAERHGHEGPFTPVVLQASQEGKPAKTIGLFDGNRAGAFTYALSRELVEADFTSPQSLRDNISERLKAMEVDQMPRLYAPSSIYSEDDYSSWLNGSAVPQPSD